MQDRPPIALRRRRRGAGIRAAGGVSGSSGKAPTLARPVLGFPRMCRKIASSGLSWLATAWTLAATTAYATPTTTWWAPATPATQGFGVPHLTYDTYFGTRGSYPIDVGATIGVIPGGTLGSEVGFDLLYPTATASGGLAFPLALNAKLGLAEGKLWAWQPAIAAGVYGVGFEKNVTDYDVLTLVVGKTLRWVGRVSVGGYYGLNDQLLADPNGQAAPTGWLASWQPPPVGVPVIDKLAFVADVQTGDNVLGGGGFAVFTSFTPAIALGLGPVGFFAPELQPGGASWMWSLQLDVDLDFREREAASARGASRRTPPPSPGSPRGA